MNTKTTDWVRFKRYLVGYWKLQAAVLILGAMSVPLGLINPYLTKLIIDKAYANRDLRLFIILALIGGGVFLLNGVLNALKGYLSQHINKKVHFDMTRDLFRRLQNLPLKFFNDQSTGEHMFRLSSDVGSVSGFICNTVPEAIRLYPRTLFTFGLVFYLNWKMALFALALVPLSLLPPYFFGKWLKEITREMIAKSEGIFRGLGEVFMHIPLVKALGKEEYETRRFEKALSQRLTLELQTAKVSNISGFTGSIINKIITGAIAFYGGYQVIQGAMSLGSLTAIMIYLSQFVGLIASIARLNESIITNSVSRDRLTALLDVKPQTQDKTNAIDFSIQRGTIEFKEITFGYKEDNPVLKNINLSIGTGTKAALVGPSGCGKTTLLSLLLRLYELQNGSIYIDGCDLADIKGESFRKQIGVALQEPFLWNDSVRNNILYAAGKASEEEILKAARIAEADDFIRRLPNGYDTLLGEYACKISDGQKQRVAIARAVLPKAKIFIFDEAMSSVDSQLEDKIINNIKCEFKDSTILMVSHRLSAIQAMDLVYFMDPSGKIEVGTHEALLNSSARYVDFLSHQLESAARIPLVPR
ncbi:MAG: ABC transporter ATP-binding protein [Candidatus Omnitrophica bacterium]|nr:ABC transporter ATP-binding protein [Candidatus Omnitrophota bacterium]